LWQPGRAADCLRAPVRTARSAAHHGSPARCRCPGFRRRLLPALSLPAESVAADASQSRQPCAGHLLPSSLGYRSGAAPPILSPVFGAVSPLPQSRSDRSPAAASAAEFLLDAHGPTLPRPAIRAVSINYLMDGSQVPVAVRPFQAGDECRWDEFVRARADGSFFHLCGWKRVIERAFGHRTHYLIAERGDTVTGVLPLTHVKSL